MKPTLAADELQRNLIQYLTATFALAEKPVREALERFLNHPEQSIFRGPYLRIRTPFQTAEPGWDDCLEWKPSGRARQQRQGIPVSGAQEGTGNPAHVPGGLHALG
ncbi:hypothetical protein [Nonomuraea africana]|uniref:hypothetical protein n=1 Tax=Nonomuraea africana TaxID=46171 RepID=UPI0033C37174